MNQLYHVRKRKSSIDQDSDAVVFGPELGTDETTQRPMVPTSQEESQLGSQESDTPAFSQETDLSSTLRHSARSRNPLITLVCDFKNKKGKML